MLPPTAISSAVAAMTAQNYGAGLYSRMKSCLRSGIGMALVFGLSFCVYSQFFPESLTGFFSKAPRLDSSSLLLMGYAPPLSTIVSLLICFWYLRRSNRKFRNAEQ